ncbi:B12-binding domain-containing radical SAM protein [Azospirillum thermophilum]|uniref:Uncharacterized protein n=1 Tax=Azospirillum thermophilum TaxID=2202148 RepID=A0A2S2D0F0_9PROT|nr:radical SAM protein [Azospirillum thermophilum]AWK90236.1 hypothetical protein DEW08_29935 [Azospirillum thermophilum]
MAKVLLVNPNRWGRGITTIWIASHAAVLRARGHEVRLFDATFYRNWAQNEIAYNTANRQYRPTGYDGSVTVCGEDVFEAVQRTLDAFDPDVVFWSALSSHIHGEGEYVNIQHGCTLMQERRTRALKVAGGLQPTAEPQAALHRFPAVDLLIAGESEFVLADLVDCVAAGASPATIPGLIRRSPDGEAVVHPRQPIIADLDAIPSYDYSLFDDQVFLRPYNGAVVRAVDYEMSRGCLYSCTYCVETVIQRYYGFERTTPRGALTGKGYLRCKSAERIAQEITDLHERYGITLFRCQDTNFLTIDRPVLARLADLMDAACLPVCLYIETRPEGINPSSAALLKRLRVDGVGMGVELATQSFREGSLNRFTDQDRIVAAFDLLRRHGIRRTAYNIIGLPGQDEDSILETIAFNRRLDPDNITVAFYSPFSGTKQQEKAAEESYFNDYEFDLDAQLRTLSRHDRLTAELLRFYKENFVRLVREGTDDLAALKHHAGLGG